MVMNKQVKKMLGKDKTPLYMYPKSVKGQAEQEHYRSRISGYYHEKAKDPLLAARLQYNAALKFMAGRRVISEMEYEEHKRRKKFEAAKKKKWKEYDNLFEREVKGLGKLTR